MNQDPVNQIIGMIQALDNKMDALKTEFGQRFDNLERRITNVEAAVVRLAGPAALPGYSRAPMLAVASTGTGTDPFARHHDGFVPHGGPMQFAHQPRTAPSTGGFSRLSHADPLTAAPPAADVGSKENASFLPFAIEHIAKRAQQKMPHDQRAW
tara:strand:- start:4010 stop:4471 length:462 start_codon:yes stop_codon:yes gene_type:complete